MEARRYQVRRFASCERARLVAADRVEGRYSLLAEDLVEPEPETYRQQMDYWKRVLMMEDYTVE